MRATPKITVDTPIGADVDLEAEDVRTSTGRRLTDTVVDELVEAATEARGVGRPSLSSPGVRSPSVTVRLPQGLNAKLDHEAARTGKRRSEIVLSLIHISEPTRRLSRSRMPSSA